MIGVDVIIFKLGTPICIPTSEHLTTILRKSVGVGSGWNNTMLQSFSYTYTYTHIYIIASIKGIILRMEENFSV